MKKATINILIILLFLVCTGCGKGEASSPSVIATSPLEVSADLLANMSITLPKEISRKPVSDIQHDFIKNDQQVGGIVIVDIPAEMLGSPRENTIQITELLGQQLMSSVDLEEIKYQHAGGNDYAYMEIATGKDAVQYTHYLFRGKSACYDVWFDMKEIKQKTVNEILATISAEDIPDELNENIF